LSIDRIYYATAQTTELAPGLEETKQRVWFTAVQLQKTDMPANVCARA